MWTLAYVIVLSSTKIIYDPVSTHTSYKECMQALHDISSTEKFDKQLYLKCTKKNDKP